MWPWPDELEQLLAKPLADFQFRASQNKPVFREDRLRQVHPSWFRGRQQKRGSLESVRFQGGGYKNVRVEHQPKGDHFWMGFALRAALMILSI